MPKYIAPHVSRKFTIPFSVYLAFIHTMSYYSGLYNYNSFVASMTLALLTLVAACIDKGDGKLFSPFILIVGSMLCPLIASLQPHNTELIKQLCVVSNFAIIWYTKSGANFCLQLYPIFVNILTWIVGVYMVPELIHIFTQEFLAGYFGTLFGIIACLRMRISYENQLLATQSSLEEMNNNYERVNKELKKEIDEKENFLLRFSHELRNPLNGIIGSLELIMQEDIQNQIVCEYLREARLCSEVLLQLLNNILDSAKMYLSSLDIAVVVCDMKDFLLKIESLTRTLVRRKRLKFEFTKDSRLPPLLNIDTHRVIQIIMNLTSNAVKFTNQGSVSIDIKYINSKCSSSTKILPSHLISPLKEERGLDQYANTDTQDYLCISIKDSGEGMSKEAQDRLFKKFSQVSAHSGHRQVGTGLGLWITKELIDSMKGNIKVDSKLGEGSTFELLLPTEVFQPLTEKNLDIQERVGFYPLEDINSQNSQNKVLAALVVEDYEYNQQIIREYLVKCGFTDIFIAQDGQQAFDLYVEKGPGFFSLVTMDLDMPIMNGKDCCQKIREWEKENEWAQTPIIITTGQLALSEPKDYTNPQGVVRAQMLITKPILFEHFEEEVISLIRKNSLSSLPSMKDKTPKVVEKIMIADLDPFNLHILRNYADKSKRKCFECRNENEVINCMQENGHRIALMFVSSNLLQKNNLIYKIRAILKEKKLAIKVVGMNTSSIYSEAKITEMCLEETIFYKDFLKYVSKI